MSTHRLPRRAAATPANKDDIAAVDAEQADTDQPDTTDSEQVEEQTSQAQAETKKAPKRGVRAARVLAYGVLPGLALLLTVSAGYLRWIDSTARISEQARIESVHAAVDSTKAMLSYRPDTVEKDLGAAQDRMTGRFRDTYNGLIHDVVIPRAKQKQISAVANVAAAASVSATVNRAVVLLFVNQTVIVGTEAPTNSASSVRVTLDRVSGRWLISQYDPL